MAAQTSLRVKGVPPLRQITGYATGSSYSAPRRARTGRGAKMIEYVSQRAQLQLLTHQDSAILRYLRIKTVRDSEDINEFI